MPERKKYCSLCGKTKPLSAFHADASKKDGYRSTCKDCQNARSRVYDQGYKERRKLLRRAWYETNKDHVRENNNTYREMHREEIRASRNAWASTRREQIRQMQKERRLKTRAQVINHYGGKCACCGESRAAFLALDHINGGGRKHRLDLAGHDTAAWLKRNDYPAGFQVLCHNCNQAKALLGVCPHQA